MAQTSKVALRVNALELTTEERNARSMNLDELNPREILELIGSEDEIAIAEARRLAPKTALLVDVTVKALQAGGSVHYFGAGTSGRVAAQDAAELYPTFHSDPGEFRAHIAGGEGALLTSVENAEDDVEAGARDASEMGPKDIAIGIAASGRTPYVGGALKKAKSLGATTALIACVPEPELAPLADHVIAANTGPEVLTGSTRMKAGTFQKVLLTGFSTAVMVGLGRTYSNLMVSVVATNEKLRSRSIRILMEGSGVSEQQAIELLDKAQGDLRLALVMGISGERLEVARQHLVNSGGVVRKALESLK